jgi:hypothetical protein
LFGDSRRFLIPQTEKRSVRRERLLFIISRYVPKRLETLNAFSDISTYRDIAMSVSAFNGAPERKLQLHWPAVVPVLIVKQVCDR